MLSLLFKIVKWLYDASVVYASSDEGSQTLVVILNEVEADGIDIPFYEPSETVSDAGAQVAQASGKSSAYVPPVGKRVTPPVNSGGNI